MSKKDLSETDIRSKFITPAIINAGWDLHKQIREEVSFTAGKIVVRGKMHTRLDPKRADYILYYKSNIPLAIVEAKDNKHTLRSGLQQGIEYGDMLDIPFVYSSNGDGFIEHDRTKSEGEIEREISLERFPSPAQLWERYCKAKGHDDDPKQKIVTQDYYFDPSGNLPRYYQRIAVNRTVEAVVQRQNRILLVMATGTGKTMTAFQIIYRLWKAGVKKRILFLADRNILVDQTMTNDFKPFGNKMTKITNRTVDKSYEIYLALYQSITGTDDSQNIFKQFSKDFFDLIIIDECHRGSAKEDSRWREVLEYFKPATQIGMTATPKETKQISNIEYFGDPLYNYSLKQGIEDGFLAPYKVMRIFFDKDVEGFRPYDGMTDKYGNVIEDMEYNTSDFDRKLVLEQRTKLVAKVVSDFLKKNNSRFDKTIFFCVDINHAERMREALINENSDLFFKNSKYVMQITGDNEEGKAQLDNFIDANETYPVLVTTSKLLTTGVDAKTCKFIVLDSNINSMTEFKQIIGRGTRIREDHNKLYFTILDFRNVTRKFADPDFDGDPVKVKEITGDIPSEDDLQEEDTVNEQDDEIIIDINPTTVTTITDNDPTTIKKYYVSNVPVEVVKKRIQYYDKDGKLTSESLEDYTRKNILKNFSSLGDFLNRWNHSDRKMVIVDELHKQGIFFDELKEEIGKDLDPFDLICHIAYDQKPLTRRERADKVKKKNYFGKYGDKARNVLEALLDKYADEGLENLENIEVLKVSPFDDMGSPLEIVKLFGDKEKYYGAISELEKQLYA